MATAIGIGWSGHLTVANAHEIARVLRRLLEGRRFTLVTRDDSPLSSNHVRTGQRLAGLGNDMDVRVTFSGSTNVTIGIHLQSMLYIVSQPAGQRAPFFIFRPDQVCITHYTHGGQKLTWVIALELADVDARDAAALLHICLTDPYLPPALAARMSEAVQLLGLPMPQAAART